MNIDRREYRPSDVDPMRETLRDMLVEEATISVRCARMAARDGWVSSPLTMKRAAWAAVLAFLMAMASCTPAQKAAFEGVLLSALEMAAKAGTRVLLDAAERELKFTSGGEE